MPNFALCKFFIAIKINQTMIKKLVVLALVAVMLACPDMAQAQRKKKLKYNDRVPVNVEEPKAEQGKPITNLMTQINGEWNVVEIKGEEINVSRSHRVFLNFDVKAGVVYGNTGVNTLNANFEVDGDKIDFDDILTSKKDGSYTKQGVEHNFLQALDDVKNISLSQAGDTEFMELKNKRNVLIKLRRQNIDFINGPWMVKVINGSYVIDRQIKLVNDVQMQSVHINSGCNIVSGVISIDPSKEFGVEYEDLRSSHFQCPNIDTETRLLIALEETMYCRKSQENAEDVELFTREIDETGKLADKVLVVLERARF